MEGYCTCGAKLPEDARFCHKCGRPLREEPVVEPEEVVEAPVIVPPVAPPPLPGIGFHNKIAVRVSLLAGVSAFVLATLSGQLNLPQAFPLVWLICAGFFAVFLYQRRTGEKLSVVGGARLGWLTGIFGFAIATVLITLTAVAIADHSAAEMLREQMKLRGLPETAAKQVLDVFHSFSGVISVLAFFFVLFTLLPMFGGAVGAKLLEKKQ